MTEFSRAYPSRRYLELQAMYRQMHEEGEKFYGLPPENTFPGKSLPPQASRIKRLIDLTGSCNILDYGSGKGMQYSPMPITAEGGQVYECIQDYWDVDWIRCYDPAYLPFSEIPEGKYDGVVSTDVLEHCPEEDIPWILNEIFGYADKFVFANVACYPAKKRLANGENAHCTIQPPEWWTRVIQDVASRYPSLKWEFWIQFVQTGPNGGQLAEQRLSNC